MCWQWVLYILLSLTWLIRVVNPSQKFDWYKEHMPKRYAEANTISLQAVCISRIMGLISWTYWLQLHSHWKEPESSLSTELAAGASDSPSAVGMLGLRWLQWRLAFDLSISECPLARLESMLNEGSDEGLKLWLCEFAVDMLGTWYVSKLISVLVVNENLILAFSAPGWGCIQSPS